MEKGPTPYPPSYEQSQALLPGPRFAETPSTNPEYKSKDLEGASAPMFAPNSGYPAPNQGHPAQNPGYPAQNPGYPAHNPGYLAHNPGYPAHNPGYPAHNPGYTAHNPGYPAPNPGYPAPNPGYSAPSPGYPTPNPGCPSQAPGFVVSEPPKPAQNAVQVTVTTLPVDIGQLGPYPCAVLCPRCRTMVISKIKQNASVTAWVSCVLLAALGCFLGCCLIPFCIGSCQNVEHFCPDCKVYLGKHSTVC